MDPYLAVCIQPSIRQSHNRTEVKENIKRNSSFLGKLVYSYKRRQPAWINGTVKLVTYPEYAFSDWRQLFLREINPIDIAVSIPGEETDLLAKQAVENDIYIAAQIIECDDRFPGHFFNAGFIIDPNGKIIYKRHKLRYLYLTLYTSPNDVFDQYMQLFAQGRSVGETVFPVAKTDIGNIGIAIAQEIQTPEIGRQLVANGAEIIVHITNEPQALVGDADPWFILDRAWAIENRVYIVAPSAGPGEELTVTSDVGTSRIIDYYGRVLSESAGTVATTIGSAIDIETLRKVRKPGLPLYTPAVFDYYKKASIPPNMFKKGVPSREELERTYHELGFI